LPFTALIFMTRRVPSLMRETCTKMATAEAT
jgi:hypothetical protein